MDVLADMLMRANARGVLMAQSEMRGDWGLEFEDGPVQISMHAVLAGELWVQAGDSTPLRLMQGDLLLVHRHGRYRFTHAPGADARALTDVLAANPPSGNPRSLVLEGEGPTTAFVCGAHSFEGMVCESLLGTLPELMPLPAALRREGPLRTVVDLIVDEIGDEAPGQRQILDRLFDLSLVYALREWFAQPDVELPLWYSAVDDGVIGPVIGALHTDPSRAWTVGELGEIAGLSSGALARRFTTVTGMPPLRYLTRWRMTLARDALSRPGTTLASISADLGYANEFAFAAAFKREVGIAPGQWRATHSGTVRRAEMSGDQSFDGVAQS